ncbi:ribosome biogenesis GTPase Der [Candidatus Dependentiae bacterium]|nr:ribosome biogenesis GTPase Der [Candidatus Dependentiae bacterium]
MKKNFPKVAIIGRTNVGKSTLFNRLTRTKASIVFEREEVTRDYIHNIISWNDKNFDLIDTGGLPLTKTADAILEEVKQSVLEIIDKADLILFVCDGKNGLIEQDRQLAKMLHQSKKPVFLLINKADNTRVFEEHAYEFQSLGFKQVFHVSALHGTGMRELLDAIAENVETVTEVPAEEPVYSVAILGKPNVGKSSLLNLLLNEQRVIVSDVAGTTRESISETLTFHRDLIQITDTPGVRRKKNVEDLLEQIMVKNSLNTLRNATIILMMIDSTDGHLSDQELKLLFYAHENGKSIILLLNKTDILEQEQKDRLKYDMLRYEFFLKKIPILWVSCKTEKNIGHIFKQIKKARERRLQTFDETKINEIIKEAFIRKPMYHKTQLLKVLHVKPIKTQDGTPTFVLYVNYPEWFGPTQLGFVENQLRRHYDLVGCPVQLIRQKV